MAARKGNPQPCAGGRHDVGGDLDWSRERVDLKEPPLQQWMKETESVLVLLYKKGYFVTDEVRRCMEHLPAAGHGCPPDETLHYCARYACAVCNLLKEKGIITEEDLSSTLGPHQSNTVPKFKVGDEVKVLCSPKPSQWRKPHLRMPGFLYGAEGKITALQGIFQNTEAMAFGAKKAMQPEYKVRFLLGDIWGALETNGGMDTVEADVLECWLERVDISSIERIQNSWPEPPAKKQQTIDQKSHHGHKHKDRGTIEQVAVDKEGPPAPGQHLCEAYVQMVIKKGFVTAEEIRETIAFSEKEAELLKGPRIIAKAWSDPKFKAKLLKDTASAVREAGFGTGKWCDSDPGMRPADGEGLGGVIITVENTSKVHNLLVCTLCSCYPKAILGRPPLWYKSSVYRARAVREPRKLLEEFGTVIPANTEVRVHDATADCRYLVLPARPKGTEGWSEEALAKIVTRDSMVGVEVLKDNPPKL